MDLLIFLFYAPDQARFLMKLIINIKPNCINIVAKRKNILLNI